jgi:hypothetical protein
MTIGSVELFDRIGKGQFNLGTLRAKDKTAFETWNLSFSRHQKQPPLRLLAITDNVRPATPSELMKFFDAGRFVGKPASAPVAPAAIAPPQSGEKQP